jgi:hypothetical protein
MPAPDERFRRIAIWTFLGMVVFPGLFVSVVWVTHPLLDYFWPKFIALAYFALPAFLSMMTGVADAHFTFWMPQPTTRIGWLLLFLFYWALSYFVARVIFRVRTRRERTNVSD